MNKTTCNLCPRNCNVIRSLGQGGVCGMTGSQIYVARAALHMWEEPCISGNTGSGTVFFSGCPLRCIYCQNYEIAQTDIGKPITIRRLAEIMIELQDKNAANINLVTPTHYTLEIIQAIQLARNQGLIIPIVYNCSGYEKVDTLRMLEGLIDIYLTDFKYMDSALAKRYSRAEDYPAIAKSALAEMVRQQPEPVFSEEQMEGQDGKSICGTQEYGMMRKGVIVRHLLLPNHVRNGKAVVQYVHETYGNQVYISLMNQYTPLPQVAGIPELNRKVTKREYESLIDFAISIGVENGFIQEGETAKESFIPAFDYEGI